MKSCFKFNSYICIPNFIDFVTLVREFKPSLECDIMCDVIASDERVKYIGRYVILTTAVDCADPAKFRADHVNVSILLIGTHIQKMGLIDTESHI